ncbi:hypothetical protein ABZZ04_31410 [Streptomyces sp. NPDC006435]|uniref:hypothetical protein n=1 Tax=Streptomyces sp. NPDC006435 TaxID=3154300 RepID=UPI0033BA9213
MTGWSATSRASGRRCACGTGVAPREPAADRRLQQVLLRQDASLVGVRNTDPDDLARTARVSVSSTLSVPAVEPGPGTEPFPLDRDLGVVLPVEPSPEGFELLVDAAAATTLRVELSDTVRAENAVPVSLLSTHDVEESGNRVRHRVHRFAPRAVSALRVCVDATNGAPRPGVVAVRACS